MVESGRKLWGRELEDKVGGVIKKKERNGKWLARPQGGRREGKGQRERERERDRGILVTALVSGEQIDSLSS